MSKEMGVSLLSSSSSSSDGYNMGILMIACLALTWIFIHRWNQRNMKGLHAGITETLRLYPAVPQDPKGILEDDVLPDGTTVKAGGMVTYVPYSMGRMKYK